MDPVIFVIFAIAYVVLLGWCIALMVRRRRVVASDLVALVVIGLIYDNAVIGLGTVIGEGTPLEIANGARYWLHAFLTPLLVMVAWHMIVRAGVKWAASAWAAAIAGSATVSLVIYEIVVGAVGMRLVPEREYGALSYANENAPDGVPVMVLVVAAALLAAGIVVGVKQKWWVLTVGVGLMLVGSAVELPIESAAATNAFELVLLVSIVWTVARQDAMASSVHSGPAKTPTREYVGEL